MSSESLHNLLFLFNTIWHERSFPSSWKQAIIIPVLKPGKDSSNPCNYRPIALTNCMCKIIEKIVNKRQLYFLETKSFFSPFQRGFPPDKYIIYSDSLSVLESMTSLLRFSHPLAFNILELHDRFTGKGFSIFFCWIPSHVGISGNELADNLAKSATNSLNSSAPVNEKKRHK
ncbi:hypothetical protein AVEN_185231-1 [Araneus ventricosus]|uniref:Uncharacterized protein n=1 Tax=Araneus ventricosus TaxID=182803 RepID=A0A4Y2P517_ARAVE|nr:hypothetical protein AVEN_185231-1 [Araneus ventricosus]